MKRISVVGVAAIAMLLAVAAFGATSASATVLCKSAPASHVCPSSDVYGAGTEISATLITPFEIKSKTLEPVDTCEAGSATSTVINASKVELSTAASLSSCSGGAVKLIMPNPTSVTWLSGTHSGKAAWFSEMEFHMFGVACKYQIGGPFELAGGNAPRWVFAGGELLKTGGSFLCPNVLYSWGEFAINSPQPLYVEEK